MTDHIHTFDDFLQSLSGKERPVHHIESELRCSECGGLDYDHERWCSETRHVAAGDGHYADAASRPPPLEIPQPTRWKAVTR